MALSIPQQIRALLEDKKHVLITFRKDGRGDAIGSAIALLLFLKKMGIRADIVADGFILPPQFSFLKESGRIAGGLPHLQKFIIVVDTAKNGVQELSYDMKDGKLHIYITPKTGFLGRDRIATAQSDFRYDVVVTVDTQDLESLGSIYQDNTEFFFKTPIVNIDHDSANEHFGHVNAVDVTMTSTAETVFDIEKQLGEEYLDADIATALLTGMIAATRSFKGDNVKPMTLATAGTLVAMGANRDFIVQNLYRTRSISTLRLWGAALTRLEHDPAIGLAWVSLTREDFVRSGADENELQDIIDELLRTSPEANVIALFHEHAAADAPRAIHVIVNAGTYGDAKDILLPYRPSGNKKQADCLVFEKTLKETEAEVITRAKTMLNTR